MSTTLFPQMTVSNYPCHIDIRIDRKVLPLVTGPYVPYLVKSIQGKASQAPSIGFPYLYRLSLVYVVT